MAKYKADAEPLLELPEPCQITELKALEAVQRTEKTRYKALLAIATGLSQRLSAQNFRLAAPEGLISECTILKGVVDAHAKVAKFMSVTTTSSVGDFHSALLALDKIDDAPAQYWAWFLQQRASDDIKMGAIERSVAHLDHEDDCVKRLSERGWDWQQVTHFIGGIIEK